MREAGRVGLLPGPPRVWPPEAQGDRSRHLGVLLMLMRVLNDLGGEIGGTEIPGGVRWGVTGIFPPPLAAHIVLVFVNDHDFLNSPF